MSLYVVLFLSFILLGMAGGLVSIGIQQVRGRAGYEVYKDEFAAAEAALNAAYGRMQFLISMGNPNFEDEVASVDPPVVAGFSFPEFSVTQTFAGNEEVADGQWKGMTIYRRRYDVDVRAKKQTGPGVREDTPGVSLQETLEINYLPLFNFAIFYDPVMEIAPGPNMVVNGRVHCNGDAYIQANNSLQFRDRVTVAGDIYHGRHPDSGESTSNGTVSFYNGDSQVNMSRGGGDSDGWLDSRDDDWVSAADDRYDGYVRSGDHGVQPLGLPIPAVEDPHSIIERADPENDSYSLQQEKFEYKAGLKIIADSAGSIPTNADGVMVGQDGDGNEVPLEYYINSEGDPVSGHPPSTGPDAGAEVKSIVSPDSFYDAREGKDGDQFGYRPRQYERERHCPLERHPVRFERRHPFGLGRRRGAAG